MDYLLLIKIKTAGSARSTDPGRKSYTFLPSPSSTCSRPSPRSQDVPQIDQWIRSLALHQIGRQLGGAAMLSAKIEVPRS